MLKIFNHKDELVAESAAAYKKDPGAWCFCFWCHVSGAHPTGGLHDRWRHTETTRICLQCEHEEGLAE
jgi:hypothetical protein